MTKRVTPQQQAAGKPITKTRAVGRHDLKTALAEDKPALLISITDPGQELSDDAIKRLGHTGDVRRLSYSADQGYDDTGITKQDVRHLHDHIAALDWEKDNVLVHCSSGLTRAPAVALLVRLMTTEGPLPERVADWKRDHPNAEPHGRTTALVADILEVPQHKMRALVDKPATPEQATPEKRPKIFGLW